ncbi:hypothetical protein M0805_002797 [Coniferiporia weirii]|nr:hypothetical protein M0805_002797 [Coniferiporia weirii]
MELAIRSFGSLGSLSLFIFLTHLLDMNDKTQGENAQRSPSEEVSGKGKLHRYRGHRAHSFTAEDVNELVEIRARQRTFDGAYARTALGNLGYSLTVLKLFDKRFYRIGLLYAVLAVALFIVSILRSRHSRHDFADCYRDGQTEAIKTAGQAGTRVFGRPFVTAGWIVLAVTLVVATVELGLLVLILDL